MVCGPLSGLGIGIQGHRRPRLHMPRSLSAGAARYLRQLSDRLGCQPPYSRCRRSPLAERSFSVPGPPCDRWVARHAAHPAQIGLPGGRRDRVFRPGSSPLAPVSHRSVSARLEGAVTAGAKYAVEPCADVPMTGHAVRSEPSIPATTRFLRRRPHSYPRAGAPA